MPRLTLGFLALLALTIAPFIPAHADDQSDFESWVVDFKARAINEGINPSVVDEAFDGLQLDPTVIELDQKQPEGKMTLEKYLSNTINARRIRIGREMMQEYGPMLKGISRKYHVQAKFIVALWGIESDYGQHQGNFSVIQSLATLAYDGRRREFFSNELIAALRILQNENMPSSELSGSWAGAMGNSQFMPSTYLRYAEDGDGDGHRDIWHSNADVFASIANYLHSIGWQADRGWGTYVELPETFSTDLLDINHPRTLGEWEKLGVVIPDKSALKGAANALYLIYPGKPEEGTLLVTANYKVILEWNRSRYFATAVGTLADKIGE